ncbi:MAG: pantetheine-phosphate adenylyltransferase [Clostridia bacterium]|nr:pantetheine-phosphate adenylyltransferase [Clostridia bacterium]
MAENIKKSGCKAVFAGMFDPVTAGHIDIIKRAAALFGEIHVLIAKNPEKSSMFSEDDRKRMIEAAVSEIGIADRVKCSVWQRPVFEYCREISASVIVKGIRNAADFDYEKVLAKQTESLCPEIETVCLISNGKYDYLSSTYVKGCIEYGLPLGESVPEAALKIIKEIIPEVR